MKPRLLQSRRFNPCPVRPPQFRMKKMKIMTAILMTAGLLASGCADRSPPRPVFPGEHWEHIAPDRAGFSPDGLAEFVKKVGGHGVVVRYGRVVDYWGHYAHLLDVASAVKPIYAHLVYMAVEDGLIGSLDEKVSVHAPNLERINEELGCKDSDITWRHLLQQTACYGVEEDPGTAFNYSDYQLALLADTLVFKVHKLTYSQKTAQSLDDYLTGPLRMQDSATLKHPNSLPGRLRISVRDFARFGLLYLNKGKWGRRQIVPRKLAEQAISTPLPANFPRTEQVEAEMIGNQRSLGAGMNLEPHLGSYSYLWWVNGTDKNGQRLLPALPEDTFLAQGHSGHDVLLVIPSLDLVVCWVDAFPKKTHATRFSEGRKNVNKAAELLMAALTPGFEEARP